MRIGHQSYDLVTELCRAWTSKDEARIQAGIIVRELCRAGMLVGAELQGMVVVDVREKPDRWWQGRANPTDAGPENSRCPMHDGAWLAREIAGLIPRTDGFDRNRVGIDIAAALLLYDQYAHGMAGESRDGNEIGTHRHDGAAPR